MPLSVITTLLGVALVALIAFCVWIAQTLITIKVVVIGVDGKNGLNSRVRALERGHHLHSRHSDDERYA